MGVSTLTNPASPTETGRAVVTQQRPGPKEIFRQMGTTNFFREAYEHGMSCSAWLEHKDPSPQYRDGTDAFQRLLQVANIRVNSDPQQGYFCDLWEKFDADANTRALAYEWAIRTAKRATNGQDVSTRAIYTSADFAAGSVIEPFVSAAAARYQQIAPAIPLETLVAITTPIQGDAYRAFYLTSNTVAQRFNRVAQGAEIPRASLTGLDHTIRLHKYGKGLDITYEVMRRQRIDLIGLHIARMQIQTEIDRVAAAIDVVVNGDGNASTAATNSNLTTLDPGTVVNVLTAKAWLTWKAQYVNPYVLTLVLAQAAPTVQAELLNLGSANIPLAVVQGISGLGGLGLITPQLGSNIRLGLTSDAPATKYVGLDSRFGLEHVTEIGADITELTRFVERQAQAIFLTYVDGFAILDANANRTLRLDA